MVKQNDNIKLEEDFGFSFVDEDVEELKQESDENIKIIQKRLDDLYMAIEPFLDNLASNPEKSTIYWPNRVDKIKKFKEKLRNIKEGIKE